MLFKVLECVTKKESEWKVLTVQSGDGQVYPNISINKMSRQGALQWPNFEHIDAGSEIEGELWQGKALYPLKKEAPRGGFGGGAAVTKHQDHKAELIEKAQDRKEEAIKLAGAMRDATLIAIAATKDTPFPTDEEFKAEWTKWCKWLLSQGEQPFL